MKEKSKYHVSDIINLIVFYCVFICFLVAFVYRTIDLIKGEVEIHRYIFIIAFIFLMCLPYLIKKIFKLAFSKITTTIFYIYMFLAAFLGNVLRLYDTTTSWDMVIHFLMGFVLAVFSLYILNYTIYKKDKSRHNMFFTCLFMILFAMGISALWEIWEFMGDLLFGLNSQRFLDQNMVPLVGQQAVMDTMMDLCMDFLGAILAVIFVLTISKFSKGFLKSFKIKKIKNKDIEDIEE